jgi:hypothetical protein
MPTPKQMEKLAAVVVRKSATTAAAQDPALPVEYWDALLNDPRAAANGFQLCQRPLSEIPRHVLRVSCQRCDRTVEIQTVDAVRLYRASAIWKHSGNGFWTIHASNAPADLKRMGAGRASI